MPCIILYVCIFLNKILAKDEGKVADAEEPDNRKALYSIKKEMIKQAIAANPREVDLRIEEIKIEEEFRGPKAEEVLDGWQKVVFLKKKIVMILNDSFIVDDCVH